MLNLPASPVNRPMDAGALAARKTFFGDNRRYAVAPVHTRFDAVSWFVWDAETPDPRRSGYASVIRQEPTAEEAIAGLI